MPNKDPVREAFHDAHEALQRLLTNGEVMSHITQTERATVKRIHTKVTVWLGLAIGDPLPEQGDDQRE